MITIKLEIASNGIIKTVTDNNYNGAGSKHENRTVYVTESDIEFNETIRFLYETCDDLGINLGNKYDENVLNFELGWGHKYNPSLDQVKSLIKDTQKNLKELKDWKTEIEQQQKVQSIIDQQSEDNVPF